MRGVTPTNASRDMLKNLTFTPPKINIEPENDGLEDVFPFPGGPYSQVRAVNLPGVYHEELILCYGNWILRTHFEA